MTTPGEFVNKALIPVWVLPVVGAVLAAALILSYISMLHAQQVGSPPTPTQVPNTVLTQVPKTPPSPTAPTAPGATTPTAPSPTAPTAPSPTAPTAPSPSPVAPHFPAGSVTTFAQSLKGAIGSQYIAGQDKLYFVEFNGSLSFLDNLSSGSPVPHVLGTGYTEPEDVYVTSDGSTAYITERSGDLVQVNLSNPNRDRDQAKVIASGLTAPQQIVVDEAGGSAYTVEFANPGRLLRIDLNTGNLTVVSGNLQNAIGLLMTPDFKAAYITEQLDNNTGKLVRIDLSNSNSTVLVTSTTAPFFFLTWANNKANAILVTERDPANKVWFVDLTQQPFTLQFVASVASRPSSVVKVSSSNLFPLLVCADSEIDELKQ